MSKAIALYNFQPSAPVELLLQKGDVILVRNADVGDGWSEGEINGKRGLFPKSFVQMLENDSPVHTAATVVPLTPQSNKKLFMETLLSPTPNTINEVFDEERATELFASSHNDIQIITGPKWSHKPPILTISVVDGPKQFRSSGVRLHTFYEVRTKELKVAVQRKYKQFLWLYDQLAEKCPCISLPPLPIKQTSDNEEEVKESRRRGLEKFLNRLARHPILGSTKVLQVFLIATDEKEWKIGTASKHSSFIKTNKQNKKLFSAPIFNCVHYPPYNVPLNQLSAFDKFSKFIETLESNVNALIRSCELLKATISKTSKSVKSLGNDLQILSRGGTPIVSGGRSLIRKPSQGISLLPTTTSSSIPQDINSDIILGGNDDTTTVSVDNELPQEREWNWRDDDKFSKLMTEFEIIGDKMRHISIQHNEHQDNIDINIIEELQEYLSIIHTLPLLVKKHEEAMSAYNTCKEKGTKKEAETMRQDCETLNNILLSELDYFSSIMIEDFQGIFLKLLKAQADYHRKVSLEWDNMYDSFYKNRPSRRATVKRSVTIPSNKTSIINEQQDIQKRPASTTEDTGTVIHYENISFNRHSPLLASITDEKNSKVQSIGTTSTDLLLQPTNVTILEDQSPVQMLDSKTFHLTLKNNTSPATDLSVEPAANVNDKESSRLLDSCTSSNETDHSTATYSPRMHTKLAKLTQLPATRQGTSNSFSQSMSGNNKESTKKLTVKTLPRLTSPPARNTTQLRNDSHDNTGSELFKKLQERRQKIESQLISNNDNETETGVLRWTRSDSKDDLSKFGIIEEGGTFTV